MFKPGKCTAQRGSGPAKLTTAPLRFARDHTYSAKVSGAKKKIVLFIARFTSLDYAETHYAAKQTPEKHGCCDHSRKSACTECQWKMKEKHHSYFALRDNSLPIFHELVIC
jgi:hypothetical protein